MGAYRRCNDKIITRIPCVKSRVDGTCLIAMTAVQPISLIVQNAIHLVQKRDAL
jgi:hypothetical protein